MVVCTVDMKNADIWKVACGVQSIENTSDGAHKTWNLQWSLSAEDFAAVIDSLGGKVINSVLADVDGMHLMNGFSWLQVYGEQNIWACGEVMGKFARRLDKLSKEHKVTWPHVEDWKETVRNIMAGFISGVKPWDVAMKMNLRPVDVMMWYERAQSGQAGVYLTKTNWQ